MPGVLTAHLQAALTLHSQFIVEPLPADLVEAWLATPPSQRLLSAKLEKLDRLSLVTPDTILADKIRLESLGAPHSSAWLQAIPCRGPVDLTLTANEVQVALRHRLGLPLASAGDRCALCAGKRDLDSIGHHQLTCMSQGMVTSRHNRLRDSLHFLCNSAGLNPLKEQGAHFGDMSRPADLLVPNWSLGKSAAFDFTVASPHTQKNIHGAGAIDVVKEAAKRKHAENDAKCDAQGWLCIPLAVDLYGRWCEEAHSSFATIANYLRTRVGCTLSAAYSSIYNTLGVVLARHNARSVLAARSSHLIGAREVRQLGGAEAFQ
jgi:hypothetical protein